MHELSICESIVQIMEDQAVAENFRTVNAVRLEIGPLAGVEQCLPGFRFSLAYLRVDLRHGDRLLADGGGKLR